MSADSSAGYSGKSLWQKLGLKPGLRLRIDNEPGNYAALVGLDAGSLCRVGPRAAFDMIHVFVDRADVLKRHLDRLATTLPPTGVIWVSWPKKSSKVPTDITEDTIRTLALPLGLVDIKVCAVDATWSGLKLVWRKAAR